MKNKEIELLLGAIYSLSCHYSDQDEFLNKVNELYAEVFGAWSSPEFRLYLRMLKIKREKIEKFLINYIGEKYIVAYELDNFVNYLLTEYLELEERGVYKGVDKYLDEIANNPDSLDCPINEFYVQELDPDFAE